MDELKVWCRRSEWRSFNESDSQSVHAVVTSTRSCVERKTCDCRKWFFLSSFAAPGKRETVLCGQPLSLPHLDFAIPSVTAWNEVETVLSSNALAWDQPRLIEKNLTDHYAPCRALPSLQISRCFHRFLCGPVTPFTEILKGKISKQKNPTRLKIQSYFPFP